MYCSRTHVSTLAHPMNPATRTCKPAHVCRFKLAMVEQPLPPITSGDSGDLINHAKLAKMIKTPICLDESLCSYEAAEVAVELGSGSIFNIKPSRCGGTCIPTRIHTQLIPPPQSPNTHPLRLGAMLDG